MNGHAVGLSELRPATTHDLILADQLSAELTAIQGKVDVKVHPVEDPLGRIHALKVCLEILPREIRGEGDDLLDTRVLGVLRTYILITGVQHILIHEGRAGGHLAEEADLDGLADLDSLTFLHEDLPGVLAAVPTIKTRYSVLLGVVAFFEWLQRGHQVVSTCDTVGNHSLGDTGCHCTLDNGGHGVHRTDNLGLVLRGDVKLDLLEQILRGTESTNNQDVLGRPVSNDVTVR